MVKTIFEDPNTTKETKELIAELLINNNFKKNKTSKWIAYIDFKYSQTEEDNISGRTRSGKLAKSNGSTDSEVPFPSNDSRLTLEYDKTFTKGSSLTIGKILDQSSSLFMNLGLNINTNNKKLKGESDVQSTSLSYIKAYKNHYFSPYIYYNSLNYRMQEDYQSKGVGLNNTYIFNDKLNLNYAVSFNDNRYHSKSSPVDPQGNQTFVDAGQLNNSEIYSASIRLNYNLSDKTQISSKLIFSDVQHSKSYDSHESSGLNLSISKIFNIGTFTASATHLTNSYDSRNFTVSSLKDREDNS